jgi:carbonic anhydrase/acetyltransferase-like protein (isoleucine patch superfamily)
MQIPIHGHTPEIDETAWVAPNATLVGQVRLGPGASVFYGAVLRADNEPIVVGRNTNIQDNCVIHNDAGVPVAIGEGVSVGHGAIIHGATIGNNVLVGMGATIMNHAVIGDEVLVAAGAVVTGGTVVPPRVLLAGVPAKVRRDLTEDEVMLLHANAEIYHKHRDEHRAANGG